jgi:hypothetical protein
MLFSYRLHGSVEVMAHRRTDPTGAAIDKAHTVAAVLYKAVVEHVAAATDGSGADGG